MKSLLKTITVFLLCTITTFSTACAFIDGFFNNTQETEQPEEQTKIELSIQNGVLNLSTENPYEKFQVYAGEDLLLETTESSIDVARKIIDTYSIGAFGEWELFVTGINGSESDDSDKITFAIKELTTENFCTVLSGDYQETDYFLLAEDIFIYGQGPYNKKLPPEGYKKTTFDGEGRKVDTNSLFFIYKTFTATLDGNGHRLYALVDEHISWAGLPFVFGAVFAGVSQNAEIKNLHAYLDFRYEARARHTASASFIFKMNGRLTDCFIDQISRPFERVKDTGNSVTDYDDADHQIDKIDNRVAIISHAEDGARFNGVVFSLKVLNLEEQPIKGGGAILYTKENVSIKNCVLINDNSEQTFISNQDGTANANSSTPKTAENIYLYNTVVDLVENNGFKILGSLTRSPLTQEFTSSILEVLGDKWEIIDDELYFLEKPIELF